MRHGMVVVVVAACGAKAPPAAPAIGNHTEITVLDPPPAGALVLDVRAVLWTCQTRHARDVVTDELRVPIGRPIKLVVSTPEHVDGIEVALGGTNVKQRVTADAPIEIGFRIDEPGEYTWRCPTLVSPGHEPADKPLYAISAAAYEAMLAANDPSVPANKIKRGAELYAKKGCVSCHSVDGSARVGPSWAGIWGSTVTLNDGTTALVDAAYVRRSIVQPTAAVVTGFPPVMPSFEGQLQERELDAIVAYIESLAPSR